MAFTHSANRPQMACTDARLLSFHWARSLSSQEAPTFLKN